MPGRESGGLLRDVGKILDGGTIAGLSEAELLQRFVARRDELAFEALVRRFGPMVFGVCRRALREASDVEDAFQATFLVLVRKAPSIRDADRLGPWIYGVARRVAGRARGVASRRDSTGQADFLDAAEARAEPELPENLRGILDDELARLPARLRDPVVFCLLDGLTYDEAATRLGWPIGTVRSRLSRARALLRDRLTRRGITAPAAALALEHAATKLIHVPPTLIDRTARIGLAFGASHRNVAAAGAVALAQEILTMMSWTSLTKLTAASVVGTVILGTAWAGAGGQEKGSEAPKPAPIAKQKTQLLEAELRELTEKRDQLKLRIVSHTSEIIALQREVDGMTPRIEELQGKLKLKATPGSTSSKAAAPRSFVDRRSNYAFAIAGDGHKIVATHLVTGQSSTIRVAEEGSQPIEIIPIGSATSAAMYFQMKGEDLRQVVAFHGGKFHNETLEPGVTEIHPMPITDGKVSEICSYRIVGGPPVLLASRFDFFVKPSASAKTGPNDSASRRFQFDRLSLDKGAGEASPPIVTSAYIQCQVGLNLCLFLPETGKWTVQKLPPGSDSKAIRQNIASGATKGNGDPNSPILVYEVQGHIFTVNRKTGQWTDVNLEEKLK